MKDKIIIKKIISENEFVVFHTELRCFLIMKQITHDEDLTNWIRIPPHTNIVQVFDTFHHDTGGQVY